METRSSTEKEILITPTSFYTSFQHGLTTESRFQLAEGVAASRGLYVSPDLRAILTNQNDSFFHQEQQSTKMLEDFENRQFISYKRMREAVIKQKEDRGQPFPRRIPMRYVNPTRITLSLEIEFQYHELMTKQIDGVENIMSIMHSTNTLIRLPDKLNVNGASPYAQQVTITGNFNDVENARSKIRENCPLSIYFEIDSSKNNIDHIFTCIQSNHISYENITIELDNLPNTDPCLKFTCRHKHIKELYKACENISSMLNNTKNEYSMCFNVSVYHLDHVVGKLRNKYMLMPMIEKQTGTKITHPSFDAVNTERDHIFPLLIRGQLKNVLEARKCITELLPVSLCININNSDMVQPIDNNNRIVDGYHSDMRVSMRVIPSRYDPTPLLQDEQPQHCITLRTKEFNIQNMYMFYSGLLNPTIKLSIPELREFQNSIWLNEIVLDDSVMKFKLPCREEVPMPEKHRKRDKIGARVKNSSSKSKSSTVPTNSQIPSNFIAQQQRNPQDSRNQQSKHQNLMTMQLGPQQQQQQQPMYMSPYFMIPQSEIFSYFPYVSEYRFQPNLIQRVASNSEEKMEKEAVIDSYESERASYNRQQNSNNRENWRENDPDESKYQPKISQTNYIETQFTAKHTLKLKQVIADEHDRLFTHDVSHIVSEDRHQSQDKSSRSRTISRNYERNENNRFENEKMYHGDDNCYRKPPNSPQKSVIKTMLAQRTRFEKPCQIINLERKKRDFPQMEIENDYSNSKVMEFMKIVTQQQKQNNVVEMEKNRTYAEILREKQRENEQNLKQNLEENYGILKMIEEEKQGEDVENHGNYPIFDADQRKLKLSSSAPTL